MSSSASHPPFPTRHASFPLFPPPFHQAFSLIRLLLRLPRILQPSSFPCGVPPARLASSCCPFVALLVRVWVLQPPREELGGIQLGMPAHPRRGSPHDVSRDISRVSRAYGVRVRERGERTNEQGIGGYGRTVFPGLPFRKGILNGP
eukprot:scaffold509_cov315-Pavlova_lutheri.AAC.2